MMNSIIYIYIIVSLLIALIYGIAAVVAVVLRRRAEQQQGLTNQYLQELISAQIQSPHALGFEVESSIDTLSHHISATNRTHRIALARAIYIMMSHTYSTPKELIRPLSSELGLDHLLLRELARANNSGKAKILNTLSAIPLERSTTEHLSPYLYSHDRHIRIAALVAMLAAAPAMAIHTIAELPYRLAPYDLSRIVALLRRGLLPIAYEPLLASDNTNLLMLGIAIVRNFGIEIADRHLYRIVSEQHSPAVIREAIYTLASLGSTLEQQPIIEKLAAMPPIHRRELCHHLGSEGYSATALRGLFSKGELQHSEPLINSYKRNLTC